MPQIRLRPMTPAEFEAYMNWVVPDYAAELERNGRATADEAMARAQASFDQLLPQGLDTPRHVMLVGEDASTGERVGHLWFAPSGDAATQAWVYDVTVEEPVRGRGYGRALMVAFETEARARGFATAGLNVFGDNETARALYLSLGYGEIARQLSKEL